MPLHIKLDRICLHADEPAQFASFCERLFGSMFDGQAAVVRTEGCDGLHILSKPCPDLSQHVALSVSDFDALMKKIVTSGAWWGSLEGEARKVTLAPDGIRCVFVRDPSGNLIEFNDRPQDFTESGPGWFIPDGSFQT